MLNNVCIMGRLVADPQIRTTSSGIPVCSFTLACNRRQSGEEQKADFIDCTAWRGLAETIAKYKVKGDMLAVSGRIETRMWEDAQGNKRKATEINVNDATFIGEKRGGDQIDAVREQVQAMASGAQFEVVDDSLLPF